MAEQTIENSEAFKASCIEKTQNMREKLHDIKAAAIKELSDTHEAAPDNANPGAAR